jgi:patatin-like phospholipase/acyl hydrolase
MIRLRPFIFDYRTLLLNEGGVRGIVMLKILNYIIKSLKTSLEAYKMFDFIIKISTGSYRLG